MATGMVKASKRWLPVVYSRESSITTSWFKESRRYLTALGISLPLKTPFPPSISLANLISSFRHTSSYASTPSRYLTNYFFSYAEALENGEGIETYGSRCFEDSFPPIYFKTHSISSFSYVGAFEKGFPHGKGIETFTNSIGER